MSHLRTFGLVAASLVVAAPLLGLPAPAASAVLADPTAPAPTGPIAAAAAAAPATSAVDEEAEGHWPLEPRPEVVRPFDPPSDPWGAGHRGVDLAGHAGQVVRTTLAGTVAFAGSVAGKPVVTVAHGDRRTTYEPVVATVAVGDTVAGGAPIGRLAVLHGHCLPAACLHWGLRRGDTYLDPLSLVGGGPVRLLPLWRDLPAPTRPWQSPLSTWRPPLVAGRLSHLVLR